MLDSQIKSLIKKKTPCFQRVERNLYIRVSAELTAFWVFQIKHNGKERRKIFGRYGSEIDELTLADARIKVAEFRARHRETDGVEPFDESGTPQRSSYQTFNDLAVDWLTQECARLANPQIPARIYNKEIKASLGKMNVDHITGLDIRDVLNTVRDSGRLAVANDTLLCLKQIFSHGIRLGITNNNPAAAFTYKHAGGTEKSRERFLSYEEVKIVFEVFRQHDKHFMTENYLALGLLLLLGVRKSELTQAKWSEFDLKKAIWDLPAERSKTGEAICISLPTQVLSWLQLLRIFGHGSDYVFPTRRAGKKGHISDDTLNHALSNLFGKRTGKPESSTGDVLGEAGIEHFVVHDLRRSCRTFLEELKVSDNVAEKCLNHKVKGIRGVYNKYQYFEERREALQKLADYIFPLLDDPRLMHTFDLE
jgi:integrase